MSRPSHQTVGRIALITGITGQDGGYLAELLLSKGYVVHGVARQASQFDRARLTGRHEGARLCLHDLDLGVSPDFGRLLAAIGPDEIYHLAGQSHVPTSHERPTDTMALNAGATLDLLEAIARSPRRESIRLFHAASAQIFADADDRRLDEQCPMGADNPYAASKLAAFEAVRQFREMHGLHVSNGILFNHESPYRGPGFVTRKISMAAAAWAHGGREVLRLGNLDARRDWGHAGDFVEAMWLMLQQVQPDDYVIATGQRHSVRDFVMLAFAAVGHDIRWQGEGVAERGFDAASGALVVMVDAAFFRAHDAGALIGNSGKCLRRLGWQARVGLAEIADEMVRADLARLSLS